MTHPQDDIDQAVITEIIDMLSEYLRNYYVFPEFAEQIIIGLQSHLRNGAYRDISEGEFLAFVVTEHLQEVNQDEHLWVRWHPGPLPDIQGPLYQDESWVEKQRQEVRSINYGFRKVEILSGNVGYLDIRKFERVDWGRKTAIAAMNFVANTEALIIDLRNCLGGYPDMVSLICSYLFSEKPVHLNSIYWKDESKTQEFWTLRNIPGDRFIGNPVYILTSKDTISAGEEFAFDLRMLDRATLVGERTNGSAHPGASYRLHPNFEVFIPIGYAINPISKDNWEGVGVEPDVSVPQEQGLTVSYKLALESIIQTLTLPPSYQNECQLVETEAALDKINSANKSPGNNPV